ncbi:MAG TPA: HEAT repeat domain-containing protein [Fibrobacteria bacterium]|nr:HEAT repeat domain-containing protein [Fibrobacteria bacterium]
MERKRHDAALMVWALAACATPTPSPAAAVPVPHREHPHILLAIPTANVLQHGQYRLSGRFQYFNSAEIGADDSLSSAEAAGKVENLNYSSEILVGFENRAEIGVQYGREPSFSIKALLLREDLLWPDLVFGARNLFSSEEGDLYGVTDEGILKDLQSESFATVAKTFGGSRLHLGLSMLTRVNKGYASVNGGLEQSLGAGAYLGYEVFERFSDFHQVVSLQWRYRDLVGFSLAMTEFQSWIRQDGRWGFFLTPSGNLTDGYNSPGISFSLQVLGWVPHREKRTLPERVAVLEAKNAELEKQLEDLNAVKEKLAGMEARGGAPASAAPAETAVPDREPAAAPLSAPQQAVVYLKAIAEKSNSDLADPKEIRETMAKLVALGPEAAEVVKRAAADTAAGAVRVHAVLVMGFSKDTAYVAPLRALCADNDPRIRREALTALVKLGGRAALEDSKRLLSDPDATVAMAAGQAYRQLKNDPVRGKPSASRKRAK